MAREGKKLELYEILAAKKAKGKAPMGFDPKTIRHTAVPETQSPDSRAFEQNRAAPGIIIDDAVSAEYLNARGVRDAPTETPAIPSPPPALTTHPVYQPPVAQPVQPDAWPTRPRDRAAPQAMQASAPMPVVPEPAPEPRPKSPREVVFGLDTAFIFFIVVLALVGSSYFLGYKRGQEERPAGLAGIGDIEMSEPGRVNLRHLAPAPRATLRPSEQDYTLILRTEPAGEDLPERLELELAEAVALGRKQGGGDIQGYIFRTGGNNPLYVLAVGLGRTANDAELDRLLKIYYRMEGVTLSREPMPYRGCRVAPVRELGTAVY